MKSTLISLVTTLLMAFALGACTQDQGETGGMGQTGSDSGSGDSSVDLPQESPAAGNRGGTPSPSDSSMSEPGAQSPDTTTGPGASSSTPPSGTTSSPSSPSSPGAEAMPPSDSEEQLQQQDEQPQNR